MIGTRIAIHASKKFDKQAASYIRQRADRMCAIGVIDQSTKDQFYYLINDCPMGAIVSSAVVGGVDVPPDRKPPITNLRTTAVTTVDRPRWFNGPFGWHMDDVVQMYIPIPIRGHQGLWNVPPEIEEVIMRAVHPQLTKKDIDEGAA